MIIWLTGNSGAGKTTLAYNLKKNINCIILDGDEMRNSISLDMGFSKKDREEHNLRVARLAKVLNKQGYLVIVSVIAPFISTRKKIDKIASIKWIYIKRSLKSNLSKPYELPTNPYLTINIDEQNEQQAEEALRKAIVSLNIKIEQNDMHYALFTGKKQG